MAHQLKYYVDERARHPVANKCRITLNQAQDICNFLNRVASLHQFDFDYFSKVKPFTLKPVVVFKGPKNSRVSWYCEYVEGIKGEPGICLSWPRLLIIVHEWAHHCHYELEKNYNRQNLFTRGYVPIKTTRVHGWHHRHIMDWAVPIAARYMGVDLVPKSKKHAKAMKWLSDVGPLPTSVMASR